MWLIQDLFKFFGSGQNARPETGPSKIWSISFFRPESIKQAKCCSHKYRLMSSWNALYRAMHYVRASHNCIFGLPLFLSSLLCMYVCNCICIVVVYTIAALYIRYYYCTRLDILFLSTNHKIHKSSCNNCFWASDPLIDRFY